MLIDAGRTRRTLVVANRTASTPLLLQQVRRRATERPTTFTLLVPNLDSKQDWTLEEALKSLRRAARGPVDGLEGGNNAFASIQRELANGAYDDVMISTSSKRCSEWLRRDLPRRVRPGVKDRLADASDRGRLACHSR